MENRIYYGEYTLKHWINLILKGNVTLPQYQRCFVWNEHAVKRFIDSLKNNCFIPPVTIAHYQENVNMILDGQQRLTSLILAYFDCYPIKDKFTPAETLANEDDGILDEDNEETDNNSKKPIEWTFKEILKGGENPEDIRRFLKEDNRYKNLSIESVDDNFFENKFIGFSYIVPESDNKEEVQRSFSLTFRNINYLGSTLSLLESRKSLYFLDSRHEKFFDGKTSSNEDVLCDLKILENMQPQKIDFVRYVSLLSQYEIFGDEKKVLKGYSAYNSRESFYADYVSYIVGMEQEKNPDKFMGFNFDSVFPQDVWKERYNIIRDTISELRSHMNLDKKDSFKSWIDADYWLFGLIYIILFKCKKVKTTDDDLASEIKNTIESKKKSMAYLKSPNRLGNIRNRLVESINIYKKHAE